ERVRAGQPLLLHLRGRGERAAAVHRALRRPLHHVRLGLPALGHRLAGHLAGDRRARGPEPRDAGAHPEPERARLLPPAGRGAHPALTGPDETRRRGVSLWLTPPMVGATYRP